MDLDAGSTEQLVASILNAAWMVRHYARGGRLTIQREERAEAIRDLGLIVRKAFIAANSSDFEPLLAAVVDGLRPKDDPPF